MRYETIEVKVPGQVSGSVALVSYILDEVNVAPGKKRPVVIVYPGGAYIGRSDRESEPVIMQFLEMGCHALLLNYSVAPNRPSAALWELVEAVAFLREHSDDWLVDMERIVVCGFSAAGHLACNLGVFWNQEFAYGPVGRIAKEICPSAMLLGHPVITSGGPAHQGPITNLLGEETTEVERRKVSLELRMTADTPKTFLWHTYEGEAVPVENSPLLASVPRKNGVNLGPYIFPKGGHGVSPVDEETSGVGDHTHVNIPCYQGWTKLAETWLKGI